MALPPLPRRARWSLALGSALLLGCASPEPGEPDFGEDAPVDQFAPGMPADSLPFGPGASNLAVQCDPSISIRGSSPALMMRHPSVLASFSLQRVVSHLLAQSKDSVTSPEEFVQRLFDTENTAQGAVFPDAVHCDDADNGAFKNGPAVDCPRAEGALAESSNLFTPGHPDSFVPVALVNRFDLTPSTLHTCGEYRIVYAKLSGLTDPDNRLFLIFEGALGAPAQGGADVHVCRPVAKLWASLEDTDVAGVAARMEELYFTGVGAFGPVIHPTSYGLLVNDDSPYTLQRGQVRVSQRMQAPWQMREFHLALDERDGVTTARLFPVTVKNNPISDLFDPANQSQRALDFRFEFPFTQGPLLLVNDVNALRLKMSNSYNSGESAFAGPAETNYLTKLTSTGEGQTLLDGLDQLITASDISRACPPSDPLLPEDLVNRAALLSCTGCHAPEQVLGPSRKIGCGLTWPNSLGQVHIDEKGAISPALTEVLLPQRAGVLTTYLQACDIAAIQKNFQPAFFGGIPD